ncbi:MAG: TetR/AcrR family transcriptional regulator [Planctomycetota bacterium]
MGPSERREREKQEVRRKILDAARELFAKHGYDAVTMRKIAEKIEYSPTAIYLHFKDIEELIQELCENDFYTFSLRFAQANTIEDPEARLRAAAQAYVDFALEHPNQYRLMFMTPHPCDPGEKAMKRRGNPREDAYAYLRELIQQSMDLGMVRKDVKDAELVAQTVWAALHGVISLEITMNMNEDPWIVWAPLSERVRLTIDTLIYGLAKQ